MQPVAGYEENCPRTQVSAPQKKGQPDSRHSFTMRTSNGCWTCRLRRKKCDENTPICDTCAALDITCHYDQTKPEWMDGRAKQKEKAEQLKREIKENAHRRQGKDNSTIELISTLQGIPNDPVSTPRKATSEIDNDIIESSAEAPTQWRHRGADRMFGGQDGPESVTFGHTDYVLSAFYLETLFPFLFPFYCPSPLRGGKAWIFEMIVSSRVVRQVALCYSSYFFSLTRGNADHTVVWEKVLKQNGDAFRQLREALQAIDSSSITEHPHAAVRVIASMIQLQRFDVAISNFSNCHSHLDASLALFQQLLQSSGSEASPRTLFKAVMGRLSPTPETFTSPCTQIPSAEQAAFRFSSATLILDDIIGSIQLRQRPRLYAYHHSLLADIENPPIDMEEVFGCKNKILVQIGEICALDAWKQQYKAAGSLDVVELVRRAVPIEEMLKAYLESVGPNQAAAAAPTESKSALSIFTQTGNQKSTTQGFIVTRVWAHAALLYLFIVVSGWQPSRCDVRHHVYQIIELLKYQISPPALLRTMVWPFCVAGCLAEPAQEVDFREMVRELQPPSLFGTVYKSLEIMENAWHNRVSEDIIDRDIATCFKGQSGLVLLV